jgi:hypothetical protein
MEAAGTRHRAGDVAGGGVRCGDCAENRKPIWSASCAIISISKLRSGATRMRPGGRLAI